LRQRGGSGADGKHGSEKGTAEHRYPPVVDGGKRPAMAAVPPHQHPGCRGIAPQRGRLPPGMRMHLISSVHWEPTSQYCARSEHARFDVIGMHSSGAPHM
jgi:hypothetical protein